MIWIIRLFLLAYAILYFGIGAWAMIDPVRDAFGAEKYSIIYESSWITSYR